MHENCVLNFDQAVILCKEQSGNSYNIEMFTMLEFEIFKQLGFDLLIPTGVDFLL